MPVAEMNKRPEVAIALTQPLWIEARTAGADSRGGISGYALAVGWDRPQDTTFYLVSDAELPRPVWVAESDITGSSIRPLAR
jgi:hypothetical protein